MSDVQKGAKSFAKNTIIIHLGDYFVCGVMKC